MLVDLPPGVSYKEYWNTPEGKRHAEYNRQFKEETDRQIAENNKRPTQYADGRGGRPAMRSPITRPPTPKPKPDRPPQPAAEKSASQQWEEYDRAIESQRRRGTREMIHPPRVPRPGAPPAQRPSPGPAPPPGPPTNTWLTLGDPQQPAYRRSAAATPPVVPLPAYAGAGARQPVTRPGQAQPKADPYEAATPAPMDTFQEIFEALEEMAPDLPSGQRRAIARSLAEEYRRERMEAMDSLAPPAPMAEPTEQMEFDQAYADMQDVGRAEDRMKARMEAQLREERVAEMKKNQLEQRRVNAQRGRAGVVGGRPQWQMDGQRPDAFGNPPPGAATGPRPGMPRVWPQRGRSPHPDFVSLHAPDRAFGQAIVRFYNPETGEEVTMPDAGYEPRKGTPWVRGRMPSPGDAQPIPPASQGDPLGGRSEQEQPAARRPRRPRPSPLAAPTRRRTQEEMYWQLVDGGMSPAEAAKAVRDAFRNAPKPQNLAQYPAQENEAAAERIRKMPTEHPPFHLLPPAMQRHHKEQSRQLLASLDARARGVGGGPG